MIRAQDRYSSENGVTQSEFRTPAMANYSFDGDTANKQLIKLQQAQELGVTQVQPLHVNLPTHGVKLTFTQALQTDVNKAMSIQCLASSTRSSSWPMTLLFSVGGFILLWMISAVAIALRRDE